MPQKSPGKTYRDAGVDLDAAAAMKVRIKELAGSTLGAGVIAGPGGFGGVIDPDPKGSHYLVSSTDSVGTKLRIAQAMGRHDTIGRDIVNHCINDILPAGAAPLFFLDYIGLSRFDQVLIAEIVSGLSAACADAGCALLGGETATLPGIYHGGDYDLVGFIVGTVAKERLLRPENTRAGDLLLGLPSSGLHTNGYSLVRSIFGIDEDPSALRDTLPGDGRTLGEALLEPHRSYLDVLKPVLHLIKGLGHNTGGGVFKNVPRALAGGLGADIDVASWEVPPLFRHIQESGNVDPLEMYRVYNMGLGMVVVVGEDQADDVRSALPESWVCGRVVERPSGERVKLLNFNG